MSFTKIPLSYTSAICHAAVVTLLCDCTVLTQYVINQPMNTCTQNDSHLKNLNKILFNQTNSYDIVWHPSFYTLFSV